MDKRKSVKLHKSKGAASAVDLRLVEGGLPEMSPSSSLGHSVLMDTAIGGWRS